MQRPFLSALAGALLIGLALPVMAADKGPNGGLLGGKGDHLTELVVTPTQLTVYVIDEGKPHSTKGITLRAVVQDAGKSATVSLTDDGGKRLVGKLTAPIGKGAIVVLTGKDDHGHPVSARYVID